MKISYLCTAVLVLVTAMAYGMLSAMQPEFIKSELDGRMGVAQDKLMLYSLLFGILAALACFFKMHAKKHDRVSFGFYY